MYNVQSQETKTYDPGERTLKFALNVRSYVEGLPQNMTNLEYGEQLIRASGSSGANYIEEEEALSRKDFVVRIKISRKESKESRYWLELTEPEEEQMIKKQKLSREVMELTKIFGSIIEKSK